MTRILAITALGFAAFTATGASAGCNPACKSGETCRYDSTKDPEYWCEAKGFKSGGITLRPGATVGAGTGPTQNLRTLGK